MTELPKKIGASGNCPGYPQLFCLTITPKSVEQQSHNQKIEVKIDPGLVVVIKEEIISQASDDIFRSDVAFLRIAMKEPEIM
mgnify:CR=1 FL=1